MDRQNFKQKYGPWALVTGASSGIGQEFARQLATIGLNVVVAARRKERLESLVNELKSEHGVEARAIAVDLTTADFLETIEASTNDLEIGLLINNAGNGVPGAFLKKSLTERTNIVQLNVAAPMQLAHRFGEKMSQRGRGGILLVSSISGYMGTPYMSNYAATKAYLLTLGEGLNVELKQHGVDVTVLMPGATRTEMAEQEEADMSKVPMTWMDAAPVAASALEALGRKTVVVPGNMNKLMTFMMTRLMPRKSASSMFGSMMKRTMDPAIV